MHVPSEFEPLLRATRKQLTLHLAVEALKNDGSGQNGSQTDIFASHLKGAMQLHEPLTAVLLSVLLNDAQFGMQDFVVESTINGYGQRHIKDSHCHLNPKRQTHFPLTMAEPSVPAKSEQLSSQNPTVLLKK